jgi:hypothetical protein
MDGAGAGVAVGGADVWTPAERDLTRHQADELGAAQQQTECANPECAGGWRKLWRGGRLYFEGEWVCGMECLRRAMAGALRRELGDTALPMQQGMGGHRHRVPLGLVLLAQGWITHPQLQRALEAQKRAGQGRIGTWLQTECGIEERKVTRGLSLQWNCPVFSMDGFEPAAMARVVPRALVERLRLLPLRLAGKTAGGRRLLYMAFEDQRDAAAEFALERMLGVQVESGLVDGSRFKAAYRRLLESRFGVETTRCEESFDGLVEAAARAVERVKPRESRLVRVHGCYWLRMWTTDGGTEDCLLTLA